MASVSSITAITSRSNLFTPGSEGFVRSDGYDSLYHYTTGLYERYTFSPSTGNLTEYRVLDSTSASGTVFMTVTDLNIDFGTIASYALTGDSYAALSVAFAGNDAMVFSHVADEVAGYLGNDTMQGNGGDDTIFGGRSIADSLDSADSIQGNDGNDLIFGNYGNDTIWGDSETASAGDGADVIYGGRGEDEIRGGAGNDSLYGGGGIAHPADEADFIVGGAGDDYILGNGGDDYIIGGAGNDTVWGGLGNDAFDIDHNSDVDTYGGINNGDYFIISPNINGTNIVDFASLMARAIATDSGVYFDLGSGNGFHVLGLSPSAFTTYAFEFVA